MARSMLKAKGMPAVFWGKAVSIAAYIVNRSPTKSLEDKTPFEAWHGRKPDVAHLRTFGCIGHVKVTRPNLAKLEDRSKPMVFLGYEAGSKAYQLYDPVERRVHISCDVVFDEAASWAGRVQAAGKGRPAEARASSPSSTRSTKTGKRRPADSRRTTWRTMAANKEGAHPLFRTVDDIIGDTTPPGSVARALDDGELHFSSAEEPPSFAVAEQGESWRRAMLEEMSSIQENQTWELVDPPANCRPIGLEWVYKVKRDERGDVVRHKARLVARGFVQRESIDFEVFAPVARMESVRLVLALAATRG
ncbi:hypothetical protein U9M48_028468 [Paspalum notatum var. saurae]|uniref:Reverse transcriptase Ty1/copia-type domain-containing protein n=1 Tax=Paspalum notatum var. saurae TaxID=547442 RepID=A0AAQ3X1F8_PASNO